MRNSKCPRCGQIKLRNFEDLSREEKIAAAAQPDAAGFSKQELKRFWFCTYCSNIVIDRTVKPMA